MWRKDVDELLENEFEFRAYLQGAGNDNVYDDEYDHPLLRFLNHKAYGTFYFKDENFEHVFDESTGMNYKMPPWVVAFCNHWDDAAVFWYQPDGEVVLGELENSLESYEVPEFGVELGGNAKLVAMVYLDNAAIRQLQTGIVVQMWKQFGGRNAPGRQRRAYHAEFDAQERAKAGRWYRKFYDWEMRSGTPNELYMKLETLAFIRRLVQFAATL